MAMYWENKIFRIFSSTGTDVTVPVDRAANLFVPCLQIGPLQQVSFNFGEPLLKNMPGVQELFSKKEKGKAPLFELLKDLKCSLPPLDYVPPPTFRQKITLPLKMGKKIGPKAEEKKEIKKEKKTKKREKGNK